MPFYSYLCNEGCEFEVEQRITEDPLTECTVSVYKMRLNEDEACGWTKPDSTCGAPCHRLLSKSSFVLKGGGWSGDGYAKSGKGETR